MSRVTYDSFGIGLEAAQRLLKIRTTRRSYKAHFSQQYLAAYKRAFHRLQWAAGVRDVTVSEKPATSYLGIGVRYDYLYQRRRAKKYISDYLKDRTEREVDGIRATYPR